MKALVIGGAGFVGGYLISQLKENGYEVAATKREQETLKQKLESIYDMELLEQEQICSVLAKTRPEVIFHLAAQSSVALSWKLPALTAEINIIGSIRLLDAVRKIKPDTRILFIGSSEEYGKLQKDELPVKETSSPHPENIYAATKFCQNMISTIYARAYGMDIINVRAFNHLGPKQPEGFVIADFCRQVAEIEYGKKEPILTVGNLEAERDFTDVRDVVCAYQMLAEHGKSGETYNVGSGQSVSIQQLLKDILSESTVSIQVKKDEKKFRPLDLPKIEADIQKLQKETGWAPKIPLKQTIRDTLNYWRKEMEAEG